MSGRSYAWPKPSCTKAVGERQAYAFLRNPGAASLMLVQQAGEQKRKLLPDIPETIKVIAKAGHIVGSECNAALEIKPCEGLPLQTGSSPPGQRSKHVCKVHGVAQLTGTSRQVDSGGSCVGCDHAPYCSTAQPCTLPRSGTDAERQDTCLRTVCRELSKPILLLQSKFAGPARKNIILL